MKSHEPTNNAAPTSSGPRSSGGGRNEMRLLELRLLGIDLRRHRALQEAPQLVQRARLEQEYRERRNGGGGECSEEARRELPVRIGEPERRHDERGELRPAGERREDAASDGRRREPEAEDEQARHHAVVRVRALRLRLARIRGPVEGERGLELQTAEAPADEPEPG